MKIGFIGLGIMGKPMAKNLLKAGYTDLLVNNRSQAPVQELEAAGAKGATQQEIGEQCDVVITMLPNSPQVKEVMLGANGVASHMKPVQSLSTALPSTRLLPKKSMPSCRRRAWRCWMLPSLAASPRRSTEP